MSPPAWAYQVDHFDPPPDEELVCSICRGVFCDAVHPPCHHVFCRACILKWLENNRNCPICRKRTSRHNLQEVVPLIKNMILKLQLRCHNSDRGCEERCSLEACENHVKECAFELVRCKNKPCKETCLRRDIHQHEQKECPHQFIKCKECNLKILPKANQKHKCIQALRKRLREQIAVIKKKNGKIAELQSEIKSLRERDRDSASTSSADSLNSIADLVFSLDSNDSASTATYYSDSDVLIQDDWTLGIPVADAAPSNPGDNVVSDISVLTDSEEDGSNAGDTVPATSEFLVLPDSSYNYARPSASDSVSNSLTAISEEAADDELPRRRTAKRKITSQVLVSSDDDNEGGGEHRTLPSPKRNWALDFNTEESTSQQHANPPDRDAAGPSTQTAVSMSESSPAGDGSRFKLKPRSKKSYRKTTAPAALPQLRRPILEATRALLERYNLESDPEWVPPSEDGDASRSMDLSNLDAEDDASSSSSDLSSSSSSSDSFLRDDGGRANMDTFSFSTDSDDDDWHP